MQTNVIHSFGFDNFKSVSFVLLEQFIEKYAYYNSISLTLYAKRSVETLLVLEQSIKHNYNIFLKKFVVQ